MAVIFPDAGKLLMRILEEKNLSEHSLDEIIFQFRNGFPTLWERFSACSIIDFLLKQPTLLNTTSQKIGATILLLGAYGPGVETLKSNPFATLIHAIVNSAAPAETKLKPLVGTDNEKKKTPTGWYIPFNNMEKRLIASLAAADASSKIWSDKLPSLIQETQDELKFEMRSPDPNLSKLAEAKELHEKLQPMNEKSGIPGYINDPEKASKKTESETLNPLLAAMEGLPELLGKDLRDDGKVNIPLAFQNHRPGRMIRPPPLHYAQDEMVWLHIDPFEVDFGEKLLLLPSNSQNATSETVPDEPEEQVESEAFQLIHHAFKEALSITQRQTLLNELQNDPEIVHDLEVTPEVLPDLVENNPIVAIDVLLKMIDSSKDMKDHLTALIQMDMSVHSMEVVNRLTSSVELPKEFLYLYISNCIKTCEAIPEKYYQNRLVRLLCVFLQSLIRNQIIDFQYLYIEILTFCVEFSRIREAAALYKLMKQVESEDPELSEVLLKKLELHQHLSEAAKNFPTKDKDTKL